MCFPPPIKFHGLPEIYPSSSKVRGAQVKIGWSGETQQTTIASLRIWELDIYVRSNSGLVGHVIQCLVGQFVIYQYGIGIDSGTCLLDWAEL